MKADVKYLQNIADTISEWLRPDNFLLKQAIERTVDEKLFGMEDIRHRIVYLKNALSADSIQRWCKMSGHTYLSANEKQILCLHAGNIPLVGIHDLLAVAISGGDYSGKLSRKDPYLMESFLTILHSKPFTGALKWSVDLQDFKSLKADAVLFSGSRESVPPVNSRLEKLGIADESVPKLIRTAHFSIAWIEDNNKNTMEDLTEAVFRYGGNGCRSAAVVVAPFHLHSEKCAFTDYIESFWLKNPQFEKPSETLFHRFAYNKALGIEQAWLNDFLIEENKSLPTEKFVLSWIKGGENNVKQLLSEYGNRVQSVYSSTAIGKRIGEQIVEPLSLAQKPPLRWKPDGIDTLNWLRNHLSD